MQNATTRGIPADGFPLAPALGSRASREPSAEERASLDAARARIEQERASLDPPAADPAPAADPQRGRILRVERTIPEPAGSKLAGKLFTIAQQMGPFPTTSHNKRTQTNYAGDQDVYATLSQAFSDIGVWLWTSMEPGSLKIERFEVDMADSVNAKADKQASAAPASIVTSCVVRMQFEDIATGETRTACWPAVSTKNESTGIQGAITTAVRHYLSKTFLKVLDPPSTAGSISNRGGGRGNIGTWNQVWALIGELKLPAERIRDLVETASGGAVKDGRLKSLEPAQLEKALELLGKAKMNAEKRATNGAST
jgi:hypothetical protein